MTLPTFTSRTLSLALGLGLGLGLCVGGGACRSNSAAGTNPAVHPTLTLNGAGSTFVNPLMARWSTDYQRVEPTTHVNYQSIGSGGGIRQLIARTVQFGATDGPMTDDQLREARSPVVHVPLAMGAVVPTYNLAGLAHPLRFTPDVLAGIFLGQITAWNDARIAAANADLTLPATPIVVVHRSDGSGTTYIFTDYLSRVSPAWLARAGRATSVNWPVGLGGRGNEGVAGTVRQTPGAVGYVELTYALQNQMSVGALRNHDGVMVEASIQSVTAAAAGALATLPADLRYSLTDAPGAAAWPLSGTTWALVYQDMPAGSERRALVSFLRWALHDGQRSCEPLHYAPLPPQLATLAEARLNLVEPPAPPAPPGTP